MNLITYFENYNNPDMKKLIVILIGFSFFTSFSQTWMDNLPEEKVTKGEVTFYEYQKAFNDFWEAKNVKNGYYYDEAGTKQKAPGWKLFKRWEYYWGQRIDRNSGLLPDYASKSIADFRSQIKANKRLENYPYIRCKV